MLTIQQKESIKATIPVLRTNGVALTTYFYERMLRHNPELKHVFNQGNQHNNKQPMALAMAVLAYAEHIDDPSVLVGALTSIAHKHVSLDIRPEQYDVVGHHLLASIGEVLTLPANSPLLEAWALAYGQLASLMTGVESQLYRQTINQTGGWSGWRPFVIRRKVRESDEITSFYLYPSDGGQVLDYRPGQFVSIRLFLPALNLLQPRQYSLSSAPNGQYYRISVKRENGTNLRPDGLVSNYLHDRMQEGAMVELTAPAGGFTLATDHKGPVVFISGGVGQTPLMSMLEELIRTQSQRSISWVHGARNEAVHAFRDVVSAWSQQTENLSCFYFYEQLNEEAELAPTIIPGWVAVPRIADSIIQPDAMYYLCGPEPFLRKQYADLTALGVQPEAIRYEEFGPQTLVLGAEEKREAEVA
jgi:nitric oxide dioxygenase